MQDNYRNICKIARDVAGRTQERWAELIGVSVESVRQYESGKTMPSDDVVLRMAEVSGDQIICYWHLLNKSRVAASLLPEVKATSLPQAVLQLINRMRLFGERHLADRLMEIAEDGKIDELEAGPFSQIMAELGEIVEAAMTLKFAKGDRDEDFS